MGETGTMDAIVSVMERGTETFECEIVIDDTTIITIASLPIEILATEILAILGTCETWRTAIAKGITATPETGIYETRGTLAI